MTLDLDHLEALARAATDRPWKHGSWPFRLTERDELELDGSPESALIAAANPAVILELVERLRRAEELIVRASAILTGRDGRDRDRIWALEDDIHAAAAAAAPRQ